MGSKLDSYIIAKFAQWALDNEYYEKMISQYHFSHENIQNSIRDPDALAISAIDLLLSTKRKEKIIQSELFFKKFNDINEKEKKWQTHVIEFPHMRGTLWRNSEMSFVFKAYLTDLKFEKELRKNVIRFVNIETENLLNAINSWVKIEEICFNIKINEMALLEILAYSCDPKWRKESNGIETFFEEIMQNFDPKI